MGIDRPYTISMPTTKIIRNPNKPAPIRDLGIREQYSPRDWIATAIRAAELRLAVGETIQQTGSTWSEESETIQRRAWHMQDYSDKLYQEVKPKAFTL